MDVKTVSSILGHYSAGFTLDTYTHATEEMQQDAAQRMGSFIAQQAEEKFRKRKRKYRVQRRYFLEIFWSGSCLGQKRKTQNSGAQN